MGHMTILTNNVNETENEMLKQFKGENNQCHYFMKVKQKSIFNRNSTSIES